ncbi:MAG TPA: LysR family transcriptional regulator [Acetobacteraceae bacterium]|nr:LysR family transcriptional regulator [Acetobacteraceae bacterium]
MSRVDMLAAYRVFVRVAEVGSFSAVAREVGMTQPAVSRQVSELERHLGTRLVQRSTRHLALTEDGQELAVRARRVLEEVEEAETAIGKRRCSPSGLVHLAAPARFGGVHIAPRVPRLLFRYPELRLELTMSDHPADLIVTGVDLAIRVGDISDTSLVSRRIGSARRLLLASEQYLQARGEPTSPAELTQHECILYTRHIGGRENVPHEWMFFGAEGTVTVPVSGRFATDNVEAIRHAIIGGLGLGWVPELSVRDELQSGRLREVLPAWRDPPIPVHVVYPSRRNLAARTRVVIDFLVEEFRQEPALSDAGAG